MSESEYVDRTPLDDPAWVIALVEERDALRARVAELEGALRRIVAHTGLPIHPSRDLLLELLVRCADIAREALPAPAPGRDTTAGLGTTTSRDLAAGGNDGE